jgi:hypothetical protein
MVENSLEKPIVITPAMSEELRLLWSRKGLTVAEFIDYCGALPNGLNEATIIGWISLRVRHALPSHWDFVVETWMVLRDAKPKFSHIKLGVRGGRPKGVDGTCRINVSPEMHQKFMSEMKRTGADITLDLVQAQSAPEGLKHRTVLVLKRQESKTIRDDYWEFIMSKLAGMPDHR